MKPENEYTPSRPVRSYVERSSIVFVCHMIIIGLYLKVFVISHTGVRFFHNIVLELE